MTGRTNAGGGAKINGIIEQYKVQAGATISAGDFVSFVNSWGTRGNLAASGSYMNGCSAVELGDNKLLFFYSNNSYAMAAVITLSGSAFTIATPVQISAQPRSGTIIRPLMLSSGNILVSYYDDSTNEYLYCVVLSVSGTTITVGTEVLVDNAYTWTGYACSMCELSGGRVALIYSRVSYSYYLTGKIIQISGLSITSLGTTVLLDSTLYQTSYLYAFLCSSGKLLVFCRGCPTTSADPSYFVLTVSYMTLSVDSYSGLSVTNSSYPAFIKVREDTFLALLSYDTSAFYLAGMVVKMNGAAVEYSGVKTLLAPVYKAAYSLSHPKIALLSEGRVGLLSMPDPLKTSDPVPFVFIVRVGDDETALESSWQIDTMVDVSAGCLATAGKSAMFAAFYESSSNTTMYGKPAQRYLTPFAGDIYGIAKTGGSDGDEIDVYIPKV